MEVLNFERRAASSVIFVVGVRVTRSVTATAAAGGALHRADVVFVV